MNQQAHPKGKRVISILWDRNISHYDLLIPKGENYAENRFRQLQNIYNRCFLEPQVRNIFPYSSIKSSTSQLCNSEKLDHHPADEIEEFNYGSSSLEELYLHKNIGDFDWDDWDALFMINMNLQLYCTVGMYARTSCTKILFKPSKKHRFNIESTGNPIEKALQKSAHANSDDKTTK